MNQYFETDEIIDMKDNFNKFIDSTKNFINGNENESKWLTIYLYMFLQSLIINSIRGTNDFYLTKKEGKINNSDWKIKIAYNLTEGYEINENNINVPVHFGREEDFQKLAGDTKKYNISIEQLKDAFFKKTKKLKSIGELYNTLNEKMKDANTLNKKKKKPLDIYRNDFNLLCKRRNGYIHFSPKSWFIDKKGFSESIIECIELLKKIIDYNIVNKSFLSSEIDLNEMENEFEELEGMLNK